MKALLTILVAILQVLLPALFKATQRTAEDSAPQPQLKRRLRDRVRRTWAAVLLCVLFLPGCVNRTIYIPQGEPVRLRQTIHGAKVWVKDANGNTVPGRVDLLEGWYCLELPPEEF